MNSPEDPTPAPANADEDQRLYVPESEGWKAVIKRDWTKQYCYYKSPGEDYFHMILSGEIYLESSTEKVCLSCAMRHGIVSTDRLFWQRRDRQQPRERLV